MTDKWIDIFGYKIKLFNNGDSTYSINTRSSVENVEQQIKNALGISGKRAFRIFTLNGNPELGQILSFGDGNISVTFEYVDDLYEYNGMNIPVLNTGLPGEIQERTLAAYNEFTGSKPNVSVYVDGRDMTIFSNIVGSSGNVVLIPPAIVGVASNLVPGEDEVNLRHIVSQLSGNFIEEQLTEANEVNGTLTFSKPIRFISIYNRDEINEGVFNVNEIEIRVPPTKEGIPGIFENGVGGIPSNIVTVSGSTKYYVSRME